MSILTILSILPILMFDQFRRFCQLCRYNWVDFVNCVDFINCVDFSQLCPFCQFCRFCRFCQFCRYVDFFNFSMKNLVIYALRQVATLTQVFLGHCSTRENNRQRTRSESAFTTSRQGSHSGESVGGKRNDENRS